MATGAAPSKREGCLQWSCTRLWKDVRFLQMVAGLMDTAHALKVAEQSWLQPHGIGFVERGPIVTDLLQVLQQNVTSASIFWHWRRA